MDVEQEQKEDEVSQWFSTYGLITAERILGRYQIDLPQDLLLAAVKNQFSFYHRILQVPLKNVLNGIVLEQASDYHVYAQKLFIDYLLSGETTSPEGAPGENTRIALEEERKGLVVLGDNFHNLELEHGSLIASSQRVLIQISQQWQTTMDAVIKQIQNVIRASGTELKPSEIRLAINYGIANNRLQDANTRELDSTFIVKMNEKLKASTDLHSKLNEILGSLVAISMEFEANLTDFFYQTAQLNEQARSYRAQFYETILRVIDLIKLLPEYKIDPVQDAINRESLYFDKTIGETNS